MARHTGKAGTVTISGMSITSVSAWSYEQSADEIETTSMGDTSKVYLGGLIDGSGTVDFRLDGGSGQTGVLTALDAGTSVTLSLGTGEETLTGSCVVTSYSVNATYGDVVGGTFGFRGKLSYS
jgi:hypothetical protein